MRLLLLGLILIFSVQSALWAKKTEKNIIGQLKNTFKTSEKAPETKEKQKVLSKIVIIGNTSISTKQIKNEIILKEGSPFNQFKIDRSIKNIRGLGFFKKISHTLKKKKKGYQLTIKVVEYQRIKNIVFKGNKAFSSETLRNQMSNKKNTIFDLKKLRTDIQAIEALYKKNGYIKSSIVKISNPSKDNPNLSIFISEGFIEDIQITGNTKTRDYVILRELDIKPGSIIQETTLQENMRRIFNLNYFTNVQPTFIPTETENGYTLQINIQEKDTHGSFSFGGGYSPSSGFSIFSDLFWDNIQGTSQLIMLKASIGLGNTYTSGYNTYQFKYFNPWALGKRKSLALKTWLTNGERGSINPMQGSLNYRNERRLGAEASIGLPHPTLKEIRTSHTGKAEYIKLLDNSKSYRILSYTLGGSYDSRDYIMLPTKGVYHNLNIEKAFKLNSKFIDFTRFNVTLRNYVPIYKKQVLAFKQTYGYITSSHLNDTDIFNSEFFYVGGGTTVRGYDNQHPFASGNKQVIYNLEYRVLFNQTFQFIIFVDAGKATSGIITRAAGFKVGKGIGVRLTIPGLGPIRLDLGVDEKGESRFHFNLGHTF